MKRKNIFGTIVGVVIVICVLMAMVQFKKEQITQKDNVTVLPGGVTIKKIEDDEEYDISKNYYKDYDDTGLETYVITTVFNYDSEESYIKEIREADICEYIYKNEEGYVDVKVTEKQRKEWLSTAEENINIILKNMEDEEKCSFEFKEKYTILESKVEKNYSLQAYAKDIINLLYNAEIMQIFSETEKEWSVNVIIENMSTGKELVNIQYPQEDLRIEPNMWKE
ncbi:hypothetical protein [Roseburia sp. 831b]|uniref:hypothetical protein n=1 Tax=Roseburia sp. 831b TaxID=1261635 RepID=UPI000951A05F|nr:hypothetical protein [Roseburia sp. 831b]WVK73197.1 hypothetical protein BIV16_01370 [Roseburia sp. 831b]